MLMQVAYYFVLLGALGFISFGMMLGWPSVTNPYLLDAAISPIPITMDQTALIAGFLMEGNAIGALFSTAMQSSPKMAVMMAHLFSMFGWMYMYIADSVLDFFVSRVIVGFANGFGATHLAKYTLETCKPEVAETLGKLLPLTVNVGVILIYSIGPYVSFRNLSLLSVMVPGVALILFACVPKTKHEINNKQAEIRKSILLNKASYTVTKCDAISEENNEQIGFLAVFKDPKILKQFGWIFLFVFAYQYGGCSAHIIYTTLIQSFVENPYPQLSSVVYAYANLLSGVLPLFLFKKLPLKLNLLVSCATTSIIMGLMSCYFYFKLALLQSSQLFCWGPLFILILYNVFLNLGLGAASPFVIKNVIPRSARSVVQKLYIIHFSLSGVLSTKVFQALFTYAGPEISYCFLCGVLLLSFVLILLLHKTDDCTLTEEERERKKAAEENAVEEVTRL